MGFWRNSTGNASASSAESTTLAASDDLRLMSEIARGRQEAFGELVDRHARYLYGIAYSLTGNAADAEDVVQETFIAVLSTTFRGQSRVRTWLVGILVRRAALLRRNRRPGRAETDPSEIADGRSSAAASAQAKLDLASMLATLSPEHREVIVLREVEQMSYEEMAAALGVPRGTVESRLHRARAELRERFKDYF